MEDERPDERLRREDRVHPTDRAGVHLRGETFGDGIVGGPVRMPSGAL